MWMSHSKKEKIGQVKVITFQGRLETAESDFFFLHRIQNYEKDW